MTPIYIFLAIFLGVFTQSVAGFGLALIMMPILSVFLGVAAAAPLVAVIAFLVEGYLLLHFRHAFNLQAVWRLSLASLVAIPLGVGGLKWVNGDLLLAILGFILVIYALYALLKLKLPHLTHPAWAWSFGFMAGLFGGAYNTSGPPYIIYGNCRQWQPAEFKSNLQGIFMLNGVVTLFSHLVSGNFTALDGPSLSLIVPAALLGLWLGLRLDKRLNPQLFRQIVLFLLVGLGLQLIFRGMR